ncbi:NAD(P)H-binding protein [Nonomuraea antri]|uniref:NAD(P)H-binding protein n=1 Tax=Nonomuraea antri TaxID=2730852 RepID=UPI002E28DBF6|nr:NAD(P)H-binding protein [Nonomuraea antri]
MILVLGGTGTTGRRVAALLRAAGQHVRAAARPGFDWSEPGTWEATLAGASRMYLMAPDGVPVEPAFVELAVRSGVGRVVLLSSMGIQTVGDERLLAAERVVRRCGAEWTIVRPSWFNQNFDEGYFRPSIMAGELAVPLGGACQAFIDADDLAAVAATALVEDGHAGCTYEPTGPRSISFPEAVAIIGGEIGREIRYLGTDEEYVESRIAAGTPRAEAEDAVKAFAALRNLGDWETTEVVERVTGRPPKPFETYAAEAAARGAWRG